ncbi:ATP-binding cassette domain-containing protein [Candidatus Bipolaricaulota bacterium]|nr:ATP-binding cassette domain-containing protein [Candidatus Bipolaricaulota bacterium]
MISVRNVTVDYGQGPKVVRAVEDVSIEIGRGESLALIGPSGCGKTSLLFAMAGLHRPVEGTIDVDDVLVQGPRKEIALILQNAGLLPWKTVLQNANLSLLLNKEYPKKTADAVLEDLGLGSVKSRFPSELSEGMKRRVGIARALSTAPSVMLMDEPLASLDTLTKERIQDLFLELWKRHQFSQVLVTHDIEEAAFLGQRVVVLTERPARIKTVVGNPDMGDLAYRGTEAFMNKVRELREAMEA